MKYPKKGTLVTVYWWDAFSYTDKHTKYYINKTRGEWNETYTAEYNGAKMEYVDIVQESSIAKAPETTNGHIEGTKIPLKWVIKIEE